MNYSVQELFNQYMREANRLGLIDVKDVIEFIVEIIDEKVIELERRILELEVK